MSALQHARVLFLDLQEGLIESARTQTQEELRTGVRVLANAARVLGLPVRASVIPTGPAGAPPLIAEIADVDTGPFRWSFGALSEPETAAWADEARDGSLILAGVATEGAVLATALQALNLGLRVSVVVDACAGLSRRAEDSAIRELEAAGARTTSITALLASADIDFATPTGIAILACLYQMIGPNKSK